MNLAINGEEPLRKSSYSTIIGILWKGEAEDNERLYLNYDYDTLGDS